MDRGSQRLQPKAFITAAFLLFSSIATSADQRQSPMPPDPLRIAHSHNDYLQKRPLFDALAQGFRSVEADIFYMSDELIVSHVGIITYGTLEELYLKPLQAIVNERGSVYGDGKTLHLWIDLKGSNDGFVEKMNEVFNRYPMLSVFTDQGMIENPVTIILTGDEHIKKTYVESYPIRRASRDSNDFSDGDPKGDLKWNWYALDWTDYFDWNGEGDMPKGEFYKLQWLVESVHVKGRRVRFFNSPQNENFWTITRTAKTDQDSTDYLQRMHDFLVQHPSPLAILDLTH